MVTSPEEDHAHPYRYGRLIDIFTVPVHYRGPKQVIGGYRRREIQVLWVRWFERDPTYEDGFSCRRIPRLRFVDPSSATEWHGFIPPSDVLRAAHLIPAFSYDLIDPQPCREGSHAVRFLEDDWNYYYVNVYAIKLNSLSQIIADVKQICRSRHVHEVPRRWRRTSVHAGNRSLACQDWVGV